MWLSVCMNYELSLQLDTHQAKQSEFPITTGLQNGSALTLYLFAVVMDALMRHIQDDIPQFMLSSNAIVLVDEITTCVSAQSEAWR